MYKFFYRHVLMPFHERVLRHRKTIDYWKQSESFQWWSLELIEQFQVEALRDLLIHAEKHSPWHRERWADFGLNVRDIRSLQDFQTVPLLTRADILQNRREMRSTDGRRLLTKATGGSSGEPLVFDIDHRSNDKRVGLTHRGYGWAGILPGSKQVHLWGAALPGTSRLQRWKAAAHRWVERKYLIDSCSLSDARLPDHIRTYNRFRPQHIVAYTNPMYELAKFVIDSGSDIHFPQSIVLGAEKVYDHQRKAIEKAFRCPVFETYGSREFMLIGAECDHHSGLHLSADNLIVEILDADGSPTPDGQEGNVVVTDLFNYGLPFIRYVNGDRAIAGFSQCPCGRGLPLLHSVTGRQLDILTTSDGSRIPGEYFPHLLKDIPWVRRFQVRQEAPDRIVLMVVPGDSLPTDRQRAELRTKILTGIPASIDLEFRLVNSIPLTGAGKHKVVVRDVTPQATEVMV